ncbi:FHA domain-containing protein [Janthinobacterium fluminis]|uniref:FHA domain-containing protein n=1 Tax=Janthinobacterium fluminis TaxID=2987524 RepID=A0ABT5K5A9_9BURK|nr:FHA domain-containing protein [Janthinobacterium fluminis]MDC8759613.1 FHA domain-containing protein [Janthinobacterium fluminis]
MAKLIISRDAQIVQTVQLAKGRLRLGRRRLNDIVLDHPTVSGEHAVIDCVADDAYLEDLNSTNGSFVNGHRVGRHFLRDQDSITLAVFQLQFRAGGAADAVAPARLELLSGAHAGRQLLLSKPQTRLGRAGMPVALIQRGAGGYALAGVAGAPAPLLNGAPLGGPERALAHGDIIEAGGTRMLFALG